MDTSLAVTCISYPTSGKKKYYPTYENVRNLILSLNLFVTTNEKNTAF